MAASEKGPAVARLQLTQWSASRNVCCAALPPATAACRALSVAMRRNARAVARSVDCALLPGVTQPSPTLALSCAERPASESACGPLPADHGHLAQALPPFVPAASSSLGSARTACSARCVLLRSALPWLSWARPRPRLKRASPVGRLRGPACSACSACSAAGRGGRRRHTCQWPPLAAPATAHCEPVHSPSPSSASGGEQKGVVWPASRP
jgi:hypothetical protein